MTAMRSIDLKAVLESTVPGTYGDLVTRPTGKAVRGGVEDVLTKTDGEAIVVIDFSTVRCLDISCADEIVGKLLVEYGTARHFILRGVTDAHCESIEQVLERHQLAVVAHDRRGRLQVLGQIADNARRAFTLLKDGGPAAATEVASQLEWSSDTAYQVLEELLTRRLVQLTADRYVALAAS